MFIRYGQWFSLIHLYIKRIAKCLDLKTKNIESFYNEDKYFREYIFIKYVEWSSLIYICEIWTMIFFNLSVD